MCPARKARPIRSETRATLVASIARGRSWLDELMSNATATTQAIAKREGCSIRKVNMTISLAFLAPNLVKAAIEGRLPHGMGVSRLIDLPVRMVSPAPNARPARAVSLHIEPSLCWRRAAARGNGIPRPETNGRTRTSISGHPIRGDHRPRTIPPNAAYFVSFREISVSTGMRGGGRSHRRTGLRPSTPAGIGKDNGKQGCCRLRTSVTGACRARDMGTSG